MKNSKACDIENTVAALEEAIRNKKMQMNSTRSHSGSPAVVPHLLTEVLNRAGGSYGQINLALEKGGAFAQDFIKKAQQHLEERPWEVLRKVAVYSFGIGLFLSLRRKKSPAGGSIPNKD